MEVAAEAIWWQQKLKTRSTRLHPCLIHVNRVALGPFIWCHAIFSRIIWGHWVLSLGEKKETTENWKQHRPDRKPVANVNWMGKLKRSVCAAFSYVSCWFNSRSMLKQIFSLFLLSSEARWSPFSPYFLFNVCVLDKTSPLFLGGRREVWEEEGIGESHVKNDCQNIVPKNCH